MFDDILNKLLLFGMDRNEAFDCAKKINNFKKRIKNILENLIEKKQEKD